MNQRTITSRKQLRSAIEQLEIQVGQSDFSDAIDLLVGQVLVHKVKFPLLENIGEYLYSWLPASDRFGFIGDLATHDYQGTSVIVGRMLGLDVNRKATTVCKLASTFIVKWDSWYSCDHTSERVFGVGLVNNFDCIFSIVNDNSTNSNVWVRRSVGIASHFAAKRNVPSAHADQLFNLLLTRTCATDREEKKGIGWGLKTLSKNYPLIVQPRFTELQSNKNIGRWAIKKIEMGLSRSEETG